MEAGLLDQLRAAGLEICAYANLLDKKEVWDTGFEQTLYRAGSSETTRREDMVADSYAGYRRLAREYRRHGATWIGGCCGCFADGIEAIARGAAEDS
mmetsp:Transcript_62888/g.178667  ORF Transcript_62888/g.178667 Transcript_62888/m.178667 type:complete len:97 (+) Transcript_62888:1-291(+)